MGDPDVAGRESRVPEKRGLCTEQTVSIRTAREKAATHIGLERLVPASEIISTAARSVHDSR